MKLSTLLVLVPVAALAVILALANREAVAFKLVPFTQESAFTLVMPLFLLVFLSFFLGVLVGGAAMGLRCARAARRKRLAARDIGRAKALDAGTARAEQTKP